IPGSVYTVLYVFEANAPDSRGIGRSQVSPLETFSHANRELRSPRNRKNSQARFSECGMTGRATRRVMSSPVPLCASAVDPSANPTKPCYNLAWLDRIGREKRGR